MESDGEHAASAAMCAISNGFNWSAEFETFSASFSTFFCPNPHFSEDGRLTFWFSHKIHRLWDVKNSLLGKDVWDAFLHCMHFSPAPRGEIVLELCLLFAGALEVDGRGDHTTLVDPVRLGIPGILQSVWAHVRSMRLQECYKQRMMATLCMAFAHWLLYIHIVFIVAHLVLLLPISDNHGTILFARFNKIWLKSSTNGLS